MFTTIQVVETKKAGLIKAQVLTQEIVNAAPRTPAYIASQAPLPGHTISGHHCPGSGFAPTEVSTVPRVVQIEGLLNGKVIAASRVAFGEGSFVVGECGGCANIFSFNEQTSRWSLGK